MVHIIVFYMIRLDGLSSKKTDNHWYLFICEALAGKLPHYLTEMLCSTDGVMLYGPQVTTKLSNLLEN